MAKDTSNSAVGTNPLVAPWSGPYGGVPPWDQVRPELFPDAFRSALAEERAEMDAIASNTEPPTFRNTVEAFDRAGRTRIRVSRLFAVATENVTNPQYQALEREWEPKLAAASDAIFMNSQLYARLAAVYESLPDSNLDAGQKRLTERLHDVFVRRGAKLGEGEKARLSTIHQELASLYASFRQKVLADEDTWTVLEAEADLAGLPPALVDSARIAAAERRLSGKWVIPNTRSSVDPFLTFSRRRDLRERVSVSLEGSHAASVLNRPDMRGAVD